MPKPWQNLKHRITAIGSYPVCAVYRFEIPLRAMIARSWCSAALYGAAGGMFDYGAANEALEFTADSPLLTQRHIALDAPTVRCFTPTTVRSSTTSTICSGRFPPPIRAPLS
jgi:hypothetical protein